MPRCGATRLMRGFLACGFAVLIGAAVLEWVPGFPGSQSPGAPGVAVAVPWLGGLAGTEAAGDDGVAGSSGDPPEVD